MFGRLLATHCLNGENQSSTGEEEDELGSHCCQLRWAGGPGVMMIGTAKNSRPSSLCRLCKRALSMWLVSEEPPFLVKLGHSYLHLGHLFSVDLFQVLAEHARCVFVVAPLALHMSIRAAISAG